MKCILVVHYLDPDYQDRLVTSHKCVFFFSEIRLTEILEGLCDSSSFECNRMLEENEEHFETWWFKRSGTQMDSFCTIIPEDFILKAEVYFIFLRAVMSCALLNRQAFLSILHLTMHELFFTASVVASISILL